MASTAWAESVVWHCVPPWAWPSANPTTRGRVVELACAAFAALQCRDYGRVDMRLSAAGEPYVIEVNECPNIDCGVEDVVLGDDLYRAIIGSLKNAIEEKLGIQRNATAAVR